MRTKILNISISQRLLSLFLINISILLIIISKGYIFTNNSASSLKQIDQNALPISSLHTENLYLLENIRNAFIDASVINEKDILTNTIKLKNKIINNLNELQRYHVDVQKHKKLFYRYFEFAYTFSLSMLENHKFKLEDIVTLQNYSAEILELFEEEKKSSKEGLSNALKELSIEANTFFSNSLIISSVGLFIMLAIGLYVNELVKYRFSDILTSVNNLIKEEPDFSIRIHNNNNDDEIGQLIELFNKLSDKLECAHNKSSKKFLAEIENTQKEVVFTMGSIAESRSNETGNHVKRVAEYSKLLALYYGLDENEAEMLKQASPMHDIGKVAIADSILNKPGSFTDEERKVMDTHVLLGYDMLKHSHRPLLKMAAVVALEHHEKWDGTGYPHAKKGEEIHIYGRITALADVFDALGSERVYKKAWDDERIFNLFKDERAKYFDPQLVDIFFDKIDDFLAIRETFKD